MHLVSIIQKAIYNRIGNSEDLKRVIENITWLLLDRFLRMGLGLIVGVWIARYLGPVDFGLISFALAFTSLFNIVASMGLKNVVVRDIVRNPNEILLTLGTAAVILIVSGIIAFVLVCLSIKFLRPEDSKIHYIVFILGISTLFKFSEISIFWFESQIKSKYVTRIQGIVFIIFTSIKVIMILFKFELISFIVLTTIEAFFQAIVLLTTMRKQGPALNLLEVNLIRAKEIIHDCWPLLLSGISVAIYTRIDQVMLGMMLDDTHVGIYSVAVRISEAFNFIPIAIVASVGPVLQRSKEKSQKHYIDHLQKLFNIMALTALSLSIPVTVFAKPIVKIIFGDVYLEASDVLIIHTWSFIFVCLGIVSSQWFLLENRQILELRRTLFGCIINVILNFILIPKYGTKGAAVATLLSYMSAALFIDLIDIETRKFFFMKLKSFNILIHLKK